MTMAQPVDLFLREMGEVLYTELRLLELLPRMEREATDPDLRAAFSRHARETEGQVKALERAFGLVDEEPLAVECATGDALVRDHDALVGQDLPPGLRDLGLAGAALKAEHWEIGAYRSLVGQAETLGEVELADALRGNMEQEQAMAAAAEELGRRLASGSEDAGGQFI